MRSLRIGILSAILAEWPSAPEWNACSCCVLRILPPKSSHIKDPKACVKWTQCKNWSCCSKRPSWLSSGPHAKATISSLQQSILTYFNSEVPANMLHSGTMYIVQKIWHRWCTLNKTMQDQGSSHPNGKDKRRSLPMPTGTLCLLTFSSTHWQKEIGSVLSAKWGLGSAKSAGLPVETIWLASWSL